MNARIESAREAVEAFAVHDYEAVGALLAPGVSWVDHPAGRVSDGREQVVACLAQCHGVFADARAANAHYTQLPDGRVLLECTGEGRQSGQFGPFACTGAAFSLPSVLICSFDDQDRICHADLYYDTMTILTQLGHALAEAA